MPKFPKDRRETLSLCYQVSAEDLELLVDFIKITGMSDDDPEISQMVIDVAKNCRQKSKKLSLQVISKEENIISVDFKKKEED